MMGTRASQSWADDHNLEVQTGHQEMILHLQSSEMLEMVIKGPNLCSLVKSPALEVFETHYRQSWPDTLWTAGLPAAPSKGHSHLLWKGLCGACKGFCPNCNPLISASPSFSQVCLLSSRFHKFAGISMSLNSLPLYQIALKIGKQFQKTFGETEGEKKFRNASTLSLFSRQERSHI